MQARAGALEHKGENSGQSAWLGRAGPARAFSARRRRLARPLRSSRQPAFLVEQMADNQAEKELLRACQQGSLEVVQRLTGQHSGILFAARSTTKGYGAVHYAAMGGSLEVLDWLVAQGMHVEDEAPCGLTPLDVALEYKRRHAVCRLEQVLDDLRGAKEVWADWAAEHRASGRLDLHKMMAVRAALRWRLTLA